MSAPRILMIEDSPLQRRLIGSYLQTMKADVDVVENGTAGLERALSGDYDLILSDVELPGVSGLEICEKVNSTLKPPIPVILASTLSSDADIERGFEAGASAYLPKPFKEHELLQEISHALQNNRARQQQKILVVDDSMVICRLVCQGLQELGFSVSSASNGHAGLRKAIEEKPDLILTDLNMPEMGGMELCRLLKKDAKLREIPIVVMSANGDRGTMRRMISLGAAAYIVKPFSNDQVAILIEKLLDDHVQLLRKDKERAELEREMMLGSIMSLVQALEARDNYTGSHSKSVAEVATLIAKELGLSESDVDSITIAGRLHDIGKIGVPDSILLKPGRLTDEEFDVVKKHPGIGYEILKPIASLKEAMPAVLHHHEKYASGGYPSNLSGCKIPLSARIVAVADVWHAVYSDRPYRPAMPREKALSILREESGKGLCPQCVEAFFKVESNGLIPFAESQADTSPTC